MNYLDLGWRNLQCEISSLGIWMLVIYNLLGVGHFGKLTGINKQVPNGSKFLKANLCIA